MDTMMNILLFYLMIGNSGAALSVDRLIARYRGGAGQPAAHRQPSTGTQAFLDAPPPSVGRVRAAADPGPLLLHLHRRPASRSSRAAWWNGQAIWDVMVNPEFTLLQYHWYEGMLPAGGRIKPVYTS